MPPKVTSWRKSTHSSSLGNCVEVGRTRGGVAVRDSKDPGGGTLVFSGPEWRAFLARIRDRAHEGI
ncbi:DUF397 domain-containing protein [Bailinhaonella thermotolerans]|uniref:DUF397 domain-containing protein n=1 Tax=Bailinhaonella thermotolerans TaxID=1070861 RepID=A0A3A4AWY9_9ACTN|nr:DUF397 domain-containing protein [Bailinhaonella thermotolerans]RJL33393.1 DUF397 domain-containing protein [Bailinhaonella thermotolerans]